MWKCCCLRCTEWTEQKIPEQDIPLVGVLEDAAFVVLKQTEGFVQWVLG